MDLVSVDVNLATKESCVQKVLRVYYIELTGLYVLQVFLVYQLQKHFVDNLNTTNRVIVEFSKTCIYLLLKILLFSHLEQKIFATSKLLGRYQDLAFHFMAQAMCWSLPMQWLVMSEKMG